MNLTGESEEQRLRLAMQRILFDPSTDEGRTRAHFLKTQVRTTIGRRNSKTERQEADAGTGKRVGRGAGCPHGFLLSVTTTPSYLVPYLAFLLVPLLLDTSQRHWGSTLKHSP